MTRQFQSPRFAGDSVLESILNDPDTGTVQLQSGSPAGSVTRVQQALFDLAWNLRVDPPVPDPTVFVDGSYGPVTTSAVLYYKIFYDIHFPPSAFGGAYDGLAGPRTLASLDYLMVLWDETVAAIMAKVASLQGAGVTVQMTVSDAPDDRTLWHRGQSGGHHVATIDGTPGAILYKRGVGAFEVHGLISATYKAAGGSKYFGYPTSDEYDDGAGFRRSDFEHGSLRLNVGTGAVELLGQAATATYSVIF